MNVTEAFKLKQGNKFSILINGELMSLYGKQEDGAYRCLKDPNPNLLDHRIYQRLILVMDALNARHTNKRSWKELREFYGYDHAIPLMDEDGEVFVLDAPYGASKGLILKPEKNWYAPGVSDSRLTKPTNSKANLLELEKRLDHLDFSEDF